MKPWNVGVLVVLAGLVGHAGASVVGYWSLDGSYADGTGQWGAGTVNDPDSKLSWATDVPAALSGRNTQSLRFEATNAKDAWVITGYEGERTLGDHVRTVSFWVKSGYLNSNTRHLGYGNTVAAEAVAISAGGASGNQIGSYYWDGNAQTPSGSYNQTGTWDHIALVYSGGAKSSGIKIYKNGVVQAPMTWVSGNEGNPLNTAVGALVIGNDAGKNAGNDIRNAWMADVTIYDEALPVAKIQSLANGADPHALTPNAISVDFSVNQSGTVNPNSVIGAQPASNWVDAPGAGGSVDIGYGATVDYSSGWQFDTIPDGSEGDDQTMMLGGGIRVGGTGDALSVSGLSDYFTRLGYDVILNIGSDNHNRLHRLTLTDTDGNIVSNEGLELIEADKLLGTMIDAEANATGNYLVFRGLTGDGFTVTDNGTTNGKPGLLGLQIVATIPEPASLALAGLALAMLIGVMRRP